MSQGSDDHDNQKFSVVAATIAGALSQSSFAHHDKQFSAVAATDSGELSQNPTDYDARPFSIANERIAVPPFYRLTFFCAGPFFVAAGIGALVKFCHPFAFEGLS